MRRVVEQAREVAARVTDDFEVIVVNDGSVDGTRELADQLCTEYPEVRAVHHDVNRGYGGAIKSGFSASQKQYIFFTDGDGQFDMNEIDKLIALLKNADLAVGWRIKRTDPFIRLVNAKAYMTLIRLLFGLKIKDVDCAFKLLPRQVIEKINLKSDGALISAELLIKARQAGFSMAQVGVHHYPRVAGEQSGAKLSVVLRMFRELWTLRSELK